MPGKNLGSSLGSAFLSLGFPTCKMGGEKPFLIGRIQALTKARPAKHSAEGSAAVLPKGVVREARATCVGKEWPQAGDRERLGDSGKTRSLQGRLCRVTPRDPRVPFPSGTGWVLRAPWHHPRVPGSAHLTVAQWHRPWQELYVQSRTRRGLGMEKAKKRLQCCTNGCSGAFRESTWVPKATLATTSVL